MGSDRDISVDEDLEWVDELPPLDGGEDDETALEGDEESVVIELSGGLDDAPIEDDFIEPFGDFPVLEEGADGEVDAGDLGRALCVVEFDEFDQAGDEDKLAEAVPIELAHELDSPDHFDDGGVDGPEADFETDVDALPPLDDDGGEDGTERGHPSSTFRSVRDGSEASVRVLRGEIGTPVVALSVTANHDAMLVVGDGAGWLSVAALDEDEPTVRALPAVGRSLLCASAIADGALWVADVDGRIWAASQPGEAWTKTTRKTEIAGRLSLFSARGFALALDARGELWCLTPGRRMKKLEVPETVTAVSLEPSGAAFIAGETAVWACQCERGAWLRRIAPEALGPHETLCIAHSGDTVVMVVSSRGWVSVDGAMSWLRAPSFDAVTAIALVSTDDGRVSALVGRNHGHEAWVESAVMGGDGWVERWQRLARVDGRDDGVPRVMAVSALDRSGARLVALTSHGDAVLIERRSESGD